MSEVNTSLLVKAQRLSAVARAMKENESDTQAEGQVATALNKLNTQLAALSNVIGSYEALKAAKIAIAAPPDLQAPVVALGSYVADIGRPSPQFLTKRTGDLGRNITDLQSAVDVAWTTWSNEQIDALRAHELSGHPPRLAVIQEQVSSLRSAARQKFSIANFQIFKVALSRVNDLIDELQTPTDLENVIARIKQGGMTLADLTESEFVELRVDPTTARSISLGVL